MLLVILVSSLVLLSCTQAETFHKLSTARGFGKRASLDLPVNRGYMATARDLGRRELPDMFFWDDDANELREKRGIRRLSLSTARGFGKRSFFYPRGTPNEWLDEADSRDDAFLETQ
ncbi:uncharacterized protein LOC135396494 isoform X2 [Ornithodoros turicata]